MAEDSFQEKTEQATPRKKEKAKEKGQVAKSRDLTTMLTMGGTVLLFYFGGAKFLADLCSMAGGVLSLKYGTDPLHVSRVAVMQAGQVLMPFLIAPVILSIAASVMQGGFVTKPLKFEVEKLNIIDGFKKQFSLKGLNELFKSILKFTAGGLIVYFIISRDLKVLPALAAMEVNEIVRVSGEMIIEAIIIAFTFFLVISIFSYLLDRWQFERSLRMTKQEIKEEMKEVEGDPIIKSRIKSIQREAARKRMMQEVPEATVVVTNPTHLAVAIKYVDREMHAPKIVAKGAGLVAAKIKEIAAEHGVPVIEDKPLARSLFKLDLESFIPEELYVAVAKILAHIYKIKGEI